MPSATRNSPVRRISANGQVITTKQAVGPPTAATLAISAPRVELIDDNQSVVTITPAMATEMLERDVLNRPIHQSRIELYAEAMRRGEWRLTYECIKLDRQGRVRDGQHRLFACIEAAVSFQTAVAINVPEDAFDVMDSGITRSNADVIHLHGYENRRQTAATARYSLLWDRTGRPDHDGRYTPSKPEILRWLEQNGDTVAEWVNIGRRIQKARIPGGEGVWAAALLRCAKKSNDDAHVFAERVISGAGLNHGDPILALRTVLIGKVRPDPVEVAALILKAWNHWRHGNESVRVLSWRRGGGSREDFPVAE